MENPTRVKIMNPHNIYNVHKYFLVMFKQTRHLLYISKNTENSKLTGPVVEMLRHNEDKENLTELLKLLPC